MLVIQHSNVILYLILRYSHNFIILPYITLYYHIWLVVEPPLWKIWKSIGSILPNIWKNEKCSKPPTKYYFTSDSNLAAPPWHRSSPWGSLAWPRPWLHWPSRSCGRRLRPWHHGWGDSQCSDTDCLECSLVNPQALHWKTIAILVETENRPFCNIFDV